ncbi:hypothetical protein, partial [Escherichia coli]|uniref:hypothetical protein n=1 Tax=Escherichia coli TaxID=562 RepID=UPI001BC86029
NRSAAFEKLSVTETAMKVRKVSESNIFRYPLLNQQVALFSYPLVYQYFYMITLFNLWTKSSFGKIFQGLC